MKCVRDHQYIMSLLTEAVVKVCSKYKIIREDEQWEKTSGV